MIYNKNEYSIKFYQNSKSGKSYVSKYIESLTNKEELKVNKYLGFLRENGGYLDEPYSRHIKGKIRELRVDFSKNRHRIFYFTFINKNIILLHAFLKKTKKTPHWEIKKAQNNYIDVINNKEQYE